MVLTNRCRLAVFFPLLALLNLFIFVLQDPSLPSTSSDITLMEMIVGHFSYLEYETANELRFPFTREIVRLSREVVRRAQSMRNQGGEGKSDDASKMTEVASFVDASLNMVSSMLL